MERVSVGDGRKESLNDDGSQKFVCLTSERAKRKINDMFIFYMVC